MLQSIIDFSVRQKLMVALMTLGLITYGIIELQRLPIDAVPDITDNQVQIITVAPSLGATDIERLITFPIEQANANIPGIKEMRSFSRFGLSLVTIVFEEDIDVYLARQQVSERLIEIKNVIPQEIGSPQLGPVTTGLGEIFQYVVRPEKGFESKYDLKELRTIQDWIVRRQLLGTPGVADVSSFGGELKQWQIQINPEKLRSQGLAIDDLFNAVESNNQNTGGSYIEHGSNAIFIRSEGLITSKDQLENIPVSFSNQGVPILMKEVAQISTGAATRFGAMCYNDQGEVAGAVVMMLKGANSSEVIENVKNKIAEIQKTLPEGIVIEAFLDRTKMVNNAISTVETNLLEGALIVILVLVIFLGNIRGGLIVASVIPLSMLFAIIMMNLFGVSGNLMSLGALDFGLIIDGAVIIVEAVLHKLHPMNRGTATKNEIEGEVKKSAGQMMSAAVFGQIIILVVYLPILSLQGIEGKMFKPMAQTVAFAIIGAFILSLTYIPMMSSLFLLPPKTNRPNLNERLMSKLERFYERLLSWAFLKKKAIIGLVIVFFTISIYIFSTLGGEFIPELEEGDFAIDTRLMTGSSLTSTIEYTQKAAGLLKKEFPEVEKVVTKIGSGEIPTDPMPIEASDMMVILKDKSEWTSATSFDELAEKMGNRLQSIPGISVGFQYPVQMRFNELMTGARQDVVCKIFGENMDSLASYAHQLGAMVQKIDGAKDLYIETVSGMPQVVVKYDRLALARHGVSVSEVNKTIQTLYAGTTVGSFYEEEKKYDIVVKMEPKLRNQLHTIQYATIKTNSGTYIPLSELANVSLIDGPNQIQRENAQRRIMVGFNVRGRDIESTVKELDEKVKQQISFMPGYSLSYGGAFENLNDATKRLQIALPVALALIFLLLYMAFHSIKQGVLIFTAIPLSAIGGIFALWLRDMPFSISAGVGFIALFGVAVLNGIVLISEFNRQLLLGKSNLEAIKDGAKLRLRPVLMTAAVASFGFLPMALSNGAGAEVQRPLATVVIGGLITATFLTLVVLPILIVITEKKLKIKPSTVAPLIIIVISILSYNKVEAQQLDSLYQKAILKNADVQQKAKEIEALEFQLSVQYIHQPTTLDYEYGQVNSAAMDQRISLVQPLPNIKRNIARREILQKEIALKYAEKDFLSKNLYASIFEAYFTISRENQRLEYLMKSDSLINEAKRIQEVQTEKGVSEKWNQQVLEGQSQKIKLQINQCINAIASAQAFILVQSGEQLDKPLTSKFPDVTSPESFDAANTPNFKLAVSQSEIIKSTKKSVLSSRLPSLAIGASAMTIKGFQNIDGTDRFYGGNEWFYTFNAGLTLPIFHKEYKKQAKALEALSFAAEAQVDFTNEKVRSQYSLEYNQWLRLQNQANECESINSANDITSVMKAYQLGELSFIEFLTIYQNIIDAQLLCIDNQIRAIQAFSQILKY
ncbi:MAG: CusA/CzcA family heavy metal efflux RND transporter [Flavobacteriales bacterium]|jgi:cobalt-zinc-cadmium resistance protein CzcA